MKIHKWMKVFSAMAASAALLAACGGGGSDPLPAGGTGSGPVTGNSNGVLGTKIVSYNGTDSALTVQGAPIGFFTYADTGGMAKTTSVAVSGNVYSVDGTLTAPGGFGGIAATLGVPAASANMTGATKLSIQLASTGTSKVLKVRIKKNGAHDSGCLPTADVTVTSTLLTYNLDLTEANFPLPSFCANAADPAPSASNPLLTGALTDVNQIQIEDNAFPSAGTTNVGIRVGEVGVVGLSGNPTVPPTTPTVTVTVGPNAVVSFADSNAATSVQGAVIQQSKYSGDETLPTTTLAITSFTSAGGRLSIVGNGGAGGYSGVGANLQLAPASATVTWATGGTISFSIASIHASDMKVMLNGGSLGDGGACYPTHDLSADGLSTTAKTLTLALDIATFPVPSGCANLTQTQAVLLADALGSLRQIQVEDNNKSAPVNFSIGEISRIAGTTNSAVFTTLRDASATSYAVSAPNYNSTQIVNGTYGSIVDNSGVITFNGAVGDRNLQVFLGGSSANIASSSTTMRIVGMTTNAKRVAFALVAAAGSGAPSCQVMYEVIVAAGTTQYDIDLSTPSTNTYGQTLCTTQADITAVRGAVGDVVIRAFGNADQGSFEITSDISFTIDKIEAN
jgi:hypothetical protein